MPFTAPALVALLAFAAGSGHPDAGGGHSRRAHPARRVRRAASPPPPSLPAGSSWEAWNADRARMGLLPRKKPARRSGLTVYRVPPPSPVVAAPGVPELEPGAARPARRGPLLDRVLALVVPPPADRRPVAVTPVAAGELRASTRSVSVEAKAIVRVHGVTLVLRQPPHELAVTDAAPTRRTAGEVHPR
jgi:hypothetical protein